MDEKKRIQANQHDTPGWSETKYSLFVMDISGRSLVNSDGSAVKGINLKEMDLSHLAKGIYFVSLKSSEINETIRITIE